MAMFPTFPSKAGQEKRKRLVSPRARLREGGTRVGESVAEVVDFSGIFAGREMEETGAGFQLKLI